MQYRVYGYVNTDQSTKYFGYYIDTRVTAAGTQRLYTRLKENSPSQWSTQYTFDTDWFTVSNKTSGTTSITITLETNAPRGNSSWSYSMAVDPAGSTLSASNGTLGVQQTLTLTRYSSGFTDSITWACGTASGTITTKSSATSFTFTPPLSLANQNTTGNTVMITFTVTTYSGNDTVQTQTTSITCEIPASIIPAAALSISDAAGYLSTYGKYIQGKSRLQIEITGTPAYGSPIVSYSATADGTTYSGASITTPVLSNTGAQTVTAKVTDQRGRSSAEVSQPYTVLAYTTPQITKIQSVRCDQSGNEDPTGHYGKVTFSAETTPLENQNSAVYTLRYKETSGSTWTEEILTAYSGTYSVTNGSAIFAAADASAFDIQIVATDDFGSTTMTSGIPVAYAILNWNNNGDGMAIGGISTQAGLQVYMDTDITGDATISGGLDLGANMIPVANGGTGADNASDALTNLGIGDIKPIAMVKHFVTTYTIAASGHWNSTLSFITVPSGYTMVGFVGLSTNDANVIPRSWRYNGNASYIYSLELRNFGSSSATHNLDLYVLFMKSNFITTQF